MQAKQESPTCERKNTQPADEKKKKHLKPKTQKTPAYETKEKRKRQAKTKPTSARNTNPACRRKINTYAYDKKNSPAGEKHIQLHTKKKKKNNM